MQQFKRYDTLKVDTGKITKIIARKHNYIRKFYIYAILLGSIFGMYIAVVELPPVASHFFFSIFFVFYFLTGNCLN